MEKNAKFIEMTETPIHRLIPKLAIPTIVSMLITSIYSMADTYFVSQLDDPSASAAVGIIFSLTTMIQTIGLSTGIGASNVISISLGQKNVERAKVVMATAFFSILFLGAAIAVLSVVFIDPLIYVLGATETIAPFAKEYALYILLATPFMAASLVLNATLRAQGNAFYAMIGLTTGGIINIILDPIFIFWFDFGIAGAAIATGISQVISFFILLWQCNYRENSITVDIKHFTPKLQIYKEIMAKGSPTFFRTGLVTVASILINIATRPFGDFAIAAVGIINRIVMFMNAFLIGYGQGFQPVAGFNFGAKKYGRVVKAYNFSLKVALVLTVATGIFCFIFAENIVMLFRKEEEIVMIGSLMLRLMCVVLPLQSISIISNMLVQSIGYSFRATIISMSRQGIFLIPLILTLPNAIGILGVQISQPISEVCSVVLSFSIAVSVIKDVKRKMLVEETSD